MDMALVLPSRLYPWSNSDAVFEELTMPLTKCSFSWTREGLKSQAYVWPKDSYPPVSTAWSQRMSLFMPFLHHKWLQMLPLQHHLPLKYLKSAWVSFAELKWSWWAKFPAVHTRTEGFVHSFNNATKSSRDCATSKSALPWRISCFGDKEIRAKEMNKMHTGFCKVIKIISDLEIHVLWSKGLLKFFDAVTPDCCNTLWQFANSFM